MTLYCCKEKNGVGEINFYINKISSEDMHFSDSKIGITYQFNYSDTGSNPSKYKTSLHKIFFPCWSGIHQ